MNTTNSTSAAAVPLANAVMPSGYCAFELPISIDQPRSVLALPGGSDVLALERGTQSVILLQDSNNDGIPDTRRLVAFAPNLNHGLAVHDGYLYASSDTTVYRWPWDGEYTTGTSEIVINNINADGNGGAPQGHKTRTLIFDDQDRLYVSVGSNGNVDPDSFRSRIRRFTLPPSSRNGRSLQSNNTSTGQPSSSPSVSSTPSSAPSNGPSASFAPSNEPTASAQPSNAPSQSMKPSISSAPSVSMAPSAAPTPITLPLDFLTGEVFADGIRNGVAMALDKHGVLWAADTGADNLKRDDLGGDITDDNPAEELMRLPEDEFGAHYGYPYCFTEYRLNETLGLGRGTAWAWPTFLATNETAATAMTVTDDDCRTVYAQADVAMQAHSTPLGIAFYNYKPPEQLPAYCPGGAFPKSMDGNVFIAFHGSWNRRVPTGYKVVYVQMDANGMAVGEPIDLLAHVPPNAKWDDGFRPTDVDFDECGRLILSSDGTKVSGVFVGSKIVRIETSDTQCEANIKSASTRTDFFGSGSSASRRRWSSLIFLAVLVGIGGMF